MSPPDLTSESLKETCASESRSLFLCVSFTRYKPDSSSSCSPNASSNASQASSGSQMLGSVESMNISMGSLRRVAELDPL